MIWALECVVLSWSLILEICLGMEIRVTPQQLLSVNEVCRRGMRSRHCPFSVTPHKRTPQKSTPWRETPAWVWNLVKELLSVKWGVGIALAVCPPSRDSLDKDPLKRKSHLSVKFSIMEKPSAENQKHKSAPWCVFMIFVQWKKLLLSFFQCLDFSGYC